MTVVVLYDLLITYQMSGTVVCGGDLMANDRPAPILMELVFGDWVYQSS